MLKRASASVSPAEAQPGSSGYTAELLSVAGSYSRTTRNFTVAGYAGRFSPLPALTDRPVILVQYGGSESRDHRPWQCGRCHAQHSGRKHRSDRAEARVSPEGG